MVQVIILTAGLGVPFQGRVLPVRVDVVRVVRLQPHEHVPLVHRGLVTLDHVSGRFLPLLELSA